MSRRYSQRQILFAQNAHNPVAQGVDDSLVDDFIKSLVLQFVRVFIHAFVHGLLP